MRGQVSAFTLIGFWLFAMVASQGCHFPSRAANDLSSTTPSPSYTFPTHNPVTATNPPKVGDIGPDFDLSSYEGENFRLTRFYGKKVLLNFFCGCEPCHELSATWQEAHRSVRSLVVLGVSTLGPRDAEQFQRETKITFPLLFDPNYEVADRYDSIHCPRSWLIAEHGRVLYTNGPQEPAKNISAALKRHLQR